MTFVRIKKHFDRRVKISTKGNQRELDRLEHSGGWASEIIAN